MRIPSAEYPRVPGLSESALGKSGPKARPSGVVDGQPVDILVPVFQCKEPNALMLRMRDCVASFGVLCGLVFDPIRL